MTDTGASGPASQNADLVRVHRELVALVERLGLEMDNCISIPEVDAVATQIQAVAGRVTSVGALLLTIQSAEIAHAADAVLSAIPELEAAIERRDRATATVGTLTNMLRLVDETIRVAKLVV